MKTIIFLLVMVVMSFAHQHEVTVGTNVPAALLNVSGVGKYQTGDNVHIVITGNNDWEYLGMYEGDNLVSSSFEYSFIINEDRHFVTLWQVKIFTVRTQVYGVGTVTGGGTFYSGQMTVMRAYPGNDYEFHQWLDGGNVLGTDETLILEVKKDYYIIGEFREKITDIENDELLADFKVEHPYPNPFNPSVNVEFKLNEESYVDIKIVDIAGRFIDQLYNGYLGVGEYSKEFTAKNLASGLYFIIYDFRGIKNSYQEVKKIMLLK